MRLFLTVIVVFIAASVAGAQVTAAPRALFANGKHSVTIPLDIDNNIIRMKVRVNGSRELTMIFDTGASMTGIDEHFVKELGLTTTADKLKGKGTGGNFSGAYVKSSTLAVGDVQVSNQPLAAFKINTPPGFDFDGVIGYDFIAAFVVEIDYQKKTMILHEPSRYVYRGRGDVIALDLSGRKTPLLRTVVAMSKGRSFIVNLELDTGADNAFLLNSPIVKRERLRNLFGTARQDMARGAGGQQDRMVVRARSVKFGRITVQKPPVALTLERVGAGAATDNGGTLGGEVLRRFKVVIDYPRARLILERNSNFDQPYEDESG